MKPLLASIFGLGFSLFVEGFSRIIISFFHKQSFVFFGIDSLPGISWIVIIYFVSLVATWLGAMLALSIANEQSKKAFRIFSILLVLWILFELLVTYQVVPIWYVISFPFTSILGLIAAHKTNSLNAVQNSPH